MIYSSWDIKCERLKLVIMDHFCPFTLRKTPKNQNFENMKKMLEISSFYKSVPETTIMRYSSWDMELHRQDSFLSFRAIFCPFTPLTTWKIKTLRKWKKHLDMSSFYTYVPKITIIWCMLPEIWSTTDKSFVILGHFLPFIGPKNQNLEKMKKMPRYIIIILLICTINGNHMMYVSLDMECNRCNFCHFGPFFAFLPH